MRNAIDFRDKQFVATKSVTVDRNTPIWAEWRLVRNKCKSLMRRKMSNYFKEKTKDLKKNKNNKKLWNLHKMHTKTKKEKTNDDITCIVDSDDIKHTDSLNIANAMNKFFCSLKCELPETELSVIDSDFEIYKKNNLINTSNFNFRKVTIDDVILAIDKLDSDSSCGITNIPVKIIKHCKKVVAKLFCPLLNDFITKGAIPDVLKCAICTPLFKKKGYINCPDNYRGISVISPFAKILERILSSDILNHFSTNNLFSPIQHGFRTNFSCETALHSLLDDWRINLDQHKFVIALFVDFKKAFDLVDQKILLRKLWI